MNATQRCAERVGLLELELDALLNGDDTAVRAEQAAVAQLDARLGETFPACDAPFADDDITSWTPERFDAVLADGREILRRRREVIENALHGARQALRAAEARVSSTDRTPRLGMRSVRLAEFPLTQHGGRRATNGVRILRINRSHSPTNGDMKMSSSPQALTERAAKASTGKLTSQQCRALYGDAIAEMTKLDADWKELHRKRDAAMDQGRPDEVVSINHAIEVVEAAVQICAKARDAAERAAVRAEQREGPADASRLLRELVSAVSELEAVAAKHRTLGQRAWDLVGAVQDARNRAHQAGLEAVAVEAATWDRIRALVYVPRRVPEYHVEIAARGLGVVAITDSGR